MVADGDADLERLEERVLLRHRHAVEVLAGGVDESKPRCIHLVSYMQILQNLRLVYSNISVLKDQKVFG